MPKQQDLTTPQLRQLLTKGVAFLFFFAFILRVTSILWGGVHNDENFNMSVKALAGQLDPDAHYYPPFLNYLNAIAYAFMYGVGRLIGVWHNLQDFRTQWFEDPTPFYFTGRLVTVILGSLSAPIAYLTSIYAQCRKQVAWLTGFLFAIFPANVWLSHYSKSDIGLCTSLLLVVLIYFYYSPTPRLRRYPLCLALATALAFSFKQSAAFFMGPFVSLLFLQLVFWYRFSLRETCTFFAIYALTSVALLIPMNIGILLDLNDFFAYQDVQSYIALRPSSLDTFWNSIILTIGNPYFGASWIGFILWILVPMVRRDIQTITIWLSTAIGLGIIGSMIGDRVQIGILLPLNMMIALTALLSIEGYLRLNKLYAKALGITAVVSYAVVFSIYSLHVVKQAMRKPLNSRVAAALIKIAPSTKTRILASNVRLLGLQIDSRALEEADLRHASLAKKYGVTLPQKSAERLEARKKASGPRYYIRRMPWAIGGLEKYEEEEIDVITPYGWPIQEEEWNLDYWKDKGFTIFVISNEDKILQSEITEYKSLYQEIQERGKLVKEIKSKRPLFEEEKVKIYVVS